MPTVMVIATVPAAYRDAIEAALSPYLLSGNADGVMTFGVPLSADGSDPATHYGTCAAVPEDGVMIAALGMLAGMFPGAAYHTVTPAEYDLKKHWLDWLTGIGLVPVVIAEK
jgi:hypothetical protein